MLDKLLESKSHSQENKKLGGFMLATTFSVLTILLSATVYALFSQPIVLGSENLEITALVAPVQLKPTPEPVEEPRIQRSESQPVSDTKVATRRSNIRRMDETPVEVPNAVSVTPSDAKARPNSSFIITGADSDPAPSGNAGSGRNPGSKTGTPENTGTALAQKLPNQDKLEEPPPVKKAAAVLPPVTGGVVNGKALELVKPVYSMAARNLGIRGEVRVQVLIDENGKVISASAVSGHALLRSSAVSAARASTFTPTLLSQQRVKVAGFIIYNFS